MSADNPLGMLGLSFVELAGDEEPLHALLSNMGFSRTRRHVAQSASVYVQNELTFVVNHDERSAARRFFESHGPCVSALGILVKDARFALDEALRRGASAAPAKADARTLLDAPAIVGIGDSLIYFVDAKDPLARETAPLPSPDLVRSVGFRRFDHLTNNVAKGELGRWANFYKSVFGFTEVRSFDIVGTKTGLYSYALRSPCGTFCIPINEDKDERGQIAEYLREYHGPGIQHVAFLTDDLLGTLDAMRGKVPTLDIDRDYYDDVFDRVKGVREDHERIASHQVLVDGDDDGYLLQIFTKNCIGPIFFEFIQRHNHLSFGEGNFGALFRSIERDQERRGVL